MASLLERNCSTGHSIWPFALGAPEGALGAAEAAAIHTGRLVREDGELLLCAVLNSIVALR